MLSSPEYCGRLNMLGVFSVAATKGGELSMNCLAYVGGQKAELWAGTESGKGLLHAARGSCRDLALEVDFDASDLRCAVLRAFLPQGSTSPVLPPKAWTLPHWQTEGATQSGTYQPCWCCDQTRCPGCLKRNSCYFRMAIQRISLPHALGVQRAQPEEAVQREPHEPQTLWRKCALVRLAPAELWDMTQSTGSLMSWFLISW